MVGIDISGTLIITGVLWFGIGIWSGHAINLDYEHYIWCLPGGWSDIGGPIIGYECQNLYLYNTAPALFLIVGNIAKLFR